MKLRRTSYMIVNKITDLIGKTPLLRIKMKNNKWQVYLKLEKFNPGGSMKNQEEQLLNRRVEIQL